MGEERKRQYNSPSRRERASATRRSIVQAARGLFRARGYGATTIAAIATAAGVAVQTVYAVFGSKRAILAELVELVKEETDVGGTYGEVMEAEDARRQMQLVARLTRRYSEGAWDVIDLLQAAGAGDTDLHAIWSDVEERRLRGTEAHIRALAGRRALRRGLSMAEATDIEWALNSSELYRLFVIEREWSPDEYERWLAAALIEQLLRPDLPATSPS